MLFSATPPSHTARTALPSGIALFTQYWLPATSPVGTVLIVHGYAEHSGRYGHVATALQQAGFAVVAYDQRGFGRSPGRRALVWNLNTLCADLAALVAHLRTHTPTPFFVLAHSMGGLVALAAALRPGLHVDGLVLSAPALSVEANVPRVLSTLADAVSRYLPVLPTVGAVENGISRDAGVIADAEADPLNYRGRVPARTGIEILRGGQRVRANAADITLPYLLVQGTADPIVDPAGSVSFHEQSGAPDKTMKRYEGLRHEVLNEPEHDVVIGDIQTWLKAHT
ncbi:MAG: lysophospholipase [Longimonas sp.]|uniref:alpha/beta hydrolase n=1 Tax=Longimonas sp. TaxID=2039626 RepID=UPI003362F515